MANAQWIWYPGDMELYFALKQNFSRIERGYGWPAFWKSEPFRQRVAFRRHVNCAEETSFRVLSDASGHVLVDDRKYAFGETVTLSAGPHDLSIHAGRIDAFPAVYVDGYVVISDSSWSVSDYNTPPVPAGSSPYFTDPAADITVFPTIWEMKTPIRTEVVKDGLLCEFDSEYTAAVIVSGAPRKILSSMIVYVGESLDEVMDQEHCYLHFHPDSQSGECPVAAVHYAFIAVPGSDIETLKAESLSVTARYERVDIPQRAFFAANADFDSASPTCLRTDTDTDSASPACLAADTDTDSASPAAHDNHGENRLSQIFRVAAHTFRLSSGVFFIDGIKRDKWIWSGDAYQSIYVNQYLTADPEIERRTLRALRGNDPVTTHINTILDYSMLWLLGVKTHYDFYGDTDFLIEMWPKMVSMMDFLLSQRDQNGFITGRPGDWIYIDWADLDKDGPLGAEQMLLAGCLHAMSCLAEVADPDTARNEAGLASYYKNLHSDLTKNINSFYWDSEKGAFIDSFTSGRRYISRQTNLFALRFGVADEAQKNSILSEVILSDTVPPITTPYFAFFEMDELGRAGLAEKLRDRMLSYWGGMLDRGAVTFWEEFDPTVTGSAQYDMYGDRFGKSLCHAWAASPIYLIGKYLLGLTQAAAGQTYTLNPNLPLLPQAFTATFPCDGHGGTLTVTRRGAQVTVTTNVTP